ncbi:hypothetical protein [Nostoc sp. MG11]|nr:hypothetical protein [Nostoc sp. MG11]
MQIHCFQYSFIHLREIPQRQHNFINAIACHQREALLSKMQKVGQTG